MPGRKNLLQCPRSLFSPTSQGLHPAQLPKKGCCGKFLFNWVNTCLQSSDNLAWYRNLVWNWFALTFRKKVIFKNTVACLSHVGCSLPLYLSPPNLPQDFFGLGFFVFVSLLLLLLLLLFWSFMSMMSVVPEDFLAYKSLIWEWGYFVLYHVTFLLLFCT